MACKLIAVAQVKGTPSMEPLLHGEALPLADFHYDLVPDMSAIAAGSADASQVPPQVQRAAVFSVPTDLKASKYGVCVVTRLDYGFDPPTMERIAAMDSSVSSKPT